MNQTSTKYIKYGESRHWLIAVICLLILLLGPLWISLIVSPELAYRTVPAKMGRFDFQADVFSSSEKYDFVFLGSSGTWTAIDHERLKGRWKENYGDDINTITLAHNWVGEEIKYLQLRELLKNNKVDWVVVSNSSRHRVPHPAAKYIWNVWSDDGFFWELPKDVMLRAYAEQVLITPRLVFSSIFGSKPLLNDSRVKKNSGSLLQEIGYRNRGEKNLAFDPTVDKQGIDLSGRGYVFKSDFSSKVADGVKRGKQLEDVANTYLSRIVDTATEHGAGVIVLYYPFATRNIGSISVEQLGAKFSSMPIIAMPVDQLFEGKDDWRPYFKNYSHLNANGAVYFANTLVPLLHEATQLGGVKE